MLPSLNLYGMHMKHIDTQKNYHCFALTLSGLERNLLSLP